MFAENYGPGTIIPYLIILFDLLKGVSWPAAAFGVIYLFRNQLSDVLSRLIKASPTEFLFRPIDQTVNENQEIASSKISTEHLEKIEDEVARHIEENNRAELVKLPVDQREGALLRALTIQQLHKSFAIIYSNIFGSQIRTLRRLNSGEISKGDALKMYESLLSEEPALSEWDLDRYLKYLLHWELIVEVDGWYAITNTGRSFLIFLDHAGLSEDRLN